MKIFISIILTFTMLFGLAFAVKAATKDNRIYSEPITAEKNSTVEIPVKIENNTGIMGFGIDVKYNAAILNPVSVEGSELLSGMLNDSIDTSEKGSFIVLYTGTESFKSDGTIFTLKFSTSEDADEDTSINLFYSQEDTFDEDFHEVKLNCENISVSFGSDPDPDEEDPKWSVIIKKWAAGLSSPWNTVMSILVAPVVFILQLFGR